MFERLNVAELGEVGFIITRLVRQNVYKTPSLHNGWSGIEFKGILKSIKSHLKSATEIKDVVDGGSGSRPISSTSIILFQLAYNFSVSTNFKLFL